MTPALATAALPIGELLPTWSVAPFAAMLLCIAVLPLLAPHLWEPNRNKAILSALLGLPVAAWMAVLEPGALLHTAHEYVAFIVLLGALFVISGGIVVRGTLAGTPGLNASLLAIGAVAASLIGTTGASVLLIRPLLRANSVRRRVVHVVVFFIFVVSNAGGLLTPLGDPPLFLGFLRGVPFLWTLRLFPQWLFVNGVLLVLFYVVDSTIFRQEDLETPGDLDEVAVKHQVPVHVGRRPQLPLPGRAWWACCWRPARSTCPPACRRRACSPWRRSPGSPRRGPTTWRTASAGGRSRRWRWSSPASSPP